MQETPVFVLVAFVIKTLPRAVKAHRKFPGNCGRFSMTSCSVLAVVRWSSAGLTEVIVVHRPLL